RLDRLNPDASLLLLKGTGSVPHEGGIRFHRDAFLARVLRDWIAQGAQPPPESSAKLTRLEVFPPARLLETPDARQQLAVTAVFNDGSRRDVTALAKFSSNDEEAADVSPEGVVSFTRPGDVTVLASYLSEVAGARLTRLKEAAGFTWSAPAENN